MTSENVIVGKCRDFQLNNSTFKTFNRPAKILALLAIIVPLAILYPTSTTNEDGDVDITTSPFAPYAGIGFLVAVIIAYFLSKQASGYKIRTNQKWAIYALNAYENFSEYQRDNAPEDYLTKGTEKLEELIDSIQSKIDSTDDNVQWIIPFVNPVEELVNILDTKILPLVENDAKQNIPQVKSYLLELMTYFISPSKSLLDELIADNTPYVKKDSELQTVTSTRPLPFRNLGIFGIFLGIGVVTFFLALSLDVEKSSAFLSGAGLTGALSGGYLAYMRKS